MALTKSLLSLSVALVASTLSASALAAEALKIGMVLPLSGPYASYGQQIERGARVYLQQHGGQIAGRKVELGSRTTPACPQMRPNALRKSC
jgi:branched-chain amino acid transport system substrate-binding protein